MTKITVELTEDQIYLVRRLLINYADLKQEQDGWEESEFTLRLEQKLTLAKAKSV